MGERGDREVPLRTAYDVPGARVALDDWLEDELRLVPVLADWTHLQLGATYVDLLDATRTEFTVRGDDRARPGHLIVPKAGVPPDLWDRLRAAD